MYIQTIKENETVTELEQAPYKMDSNERNLRKKSWTEREPTVLLSYHHTPISSIPRCPLQVCYAL